MFVVTMTTGAKITLSAKELELVCNTDWILTKHAVIQKVYDLFGGLLPLMENILQQNKEHLPAEVFIHSPKISKGENYKLLPYVMLDYPRCFGKDDSVAIRNFFWWGNYFSVCLQLSGRFKNDSTALLCQNFESLQQNGYAICINDDPWEHHFEQNNFASLELLSKDDFRKVLLEKPFVKIAKNISLQQWQQVPEFILKTFAELVGLIQNN
jgi:hypothetical protein